MSKTNKRGQASAAALIGIIAFLLLVYIVFLPPEERRALLEDEETSSTSAPSAYNDGPVNLFLANPGKIDYLPQTEVEHSLQSFNLLTSAAGTLIEEKNSLHVANALFTRETANLTFRFSNVDDVDNVLLNFMVKSHEGRLIILLNSEEIYNSEITTVNIAPIELKKKYLQNENTLVFMSSSPGFAFWKTHEYSIEKITVSADVLNVEAQKSSQVFLVDPEERNNLNKVTVRFFPDCDVARAGILTAKLNQQEIFKGIPDCGMSFRQEYPAYYLNEGQNTLSFETDAGHYLIDRVSVQSELKKARDFIYDFKINQSLLKEIQETDLNIYLVMKFDDYYYKEADLIINGHVTHLSTEDTEYARDLQTMIKEDYNYIKIVPKATMFVPELRIELDATGYYENRIK